MDAEGAELEAMFRQFFVELGFRRFVERLNETEMKMAVVRCLLGDESIITNLGTLPLHELARNHQVKSIEKFLDSHRNEVDCTDPESGVTPLMTACFYGRLQVVKLLVSRGANVNFKCSGINSFGMKYSDVTPVYVAAEEGHLEVIEFLVEMGADVNVKCSPLGFTPLHCAICRGYDDVVFLLVNDFDASVNVKNSIGEDSILTAVIRRAHKILYILILSQGADCSVPDTNEKVTPLHYAAYHGDYVSVEALHLVGNANLNAELVGGFTPLDLAIQQKHELVSDFLRSVGAQRKVRHGKWQPFINCIAGGLLPLEAALNRGVNVNAVIFEGGTALHYNVNKLDWQACEFLLRKGANVNHRNHFGNTPLHLAVELGQTDFIKLLLKNGADVDAVDCVGTTPLHLTAHGGNYSAAKMLITHGANLNIADYGGGTPIFAAAFKGHSDVIKLLLSYGVDPNSKDSVNGIPVIIIACIHSGHKPDVIKALIDGGADVNARVKTHLAELGVLPFFPIENFRYYESLKILIEAGALIDAEIKATHPLGIGNVSREVEMHITPLMAAMATKNERAINMFINTLELFKSVRKNDLKLAKVHIAQGGLVNCCCAKFESPLIYASWKGNLDMVKLLLKHGASLTLQGVKKSSPLHYAAKFNNKSVVIELLRAGAKYDVVCCGKTALQLAEEGGHVEVASLLKFAAKWFDSTGTVHVRSTANSVADPRFKKLLEEANNKVLEEDLCALFRRIL